ncbi:MAG TPA: VWA domain-containing protein [Bdellovibrio sp.]|uniref:vWA domain-containing protein n=1 Tax=Bdellovibrio sp. TaxID=28201 RepID=UPI002EEA6804
MMSIAFLLLLDYSGSMDQPLEKSPKIQTVKSQVGALLSTQAPQDNAEAIVFGTQPQFGCDDIRAFKLPLPQMSKKISELNPGAYGKTPLTQGFRLLVDRLKHNDITKAIVITDGADTCGENPCEYLQKVDKTFKKAQPYDIYLVGLDLKEDRPQMECFKDLKLNNFKIHFADINSKEDLLNQLKQSQFSESEILHEIKDSQRTGDTKIKIFKLKNQAQRKNSQSTDKQKPDPTKMARLEITGAPNEAQFHIEGAKHVQDWKGPFVVSVPSDTYKIRFVDNENGSEITFKLAEGTLTKIPWAQLMKYSTGEMQISSASLTLRWKPTASTQKIHGDLKPIETTATLGVASVDIPKLQFGQWDVEVISPPWLAKRLGPRSIKVENHQKNSLDLKSLYAEDIAWVKAPPSKTGQVLVIQSKDAHEERHFIPAGQDQFDIPVPAKFEIRWLSP